jgi:hypothetical protein
MSCAIALLLALPAHAESGVGDCATARDPGRCEAQRAALKACADARGPAKRACLDAALPPVDCSKASDPERCDKTQKAVRSLQHQDRQGTEEMPARRSAEKEKAAKARKPAAPRLKPATTPHPDAAGRRRLTC